MRIRGTNLSSMVVFVLTSALVFTSASSLGFDGRSPADTGRRYIGKLQRSGPNVFVNGRKAPFGQSIYEDTLVTTGARSSAKILYATGGFTQLDEHTDPWFGIRVDKETRRECIYIRIDIGQVFIDKDLHCFETPDVAGVLNSKVNVAASSRETIFTVLRGSASMSRPPDVIVGMGEQAGFSNGRIVYEPVPLSPEQLRAIESWRFRYDFKVPAPPADDREFRPPPFIFPRPPWRDSDREHRPREDRHPPRDRPRDPGSSDKPPKEKPDRPSQDTDEMEPPSKPEPPVLRPLPRDDRIREKIRDGIRDEIRRTPTEPDLR